jgi:uncharacterized peroxidase-related enzyme
VYRTFGTSLILTPLPEFTAMPRISPVDPAAVPGAAAEQLAVTKKLLGSTPNMFATAARSPATLTAMNGFFAALGKSALGGKIGEQVAIAVAQSNGCEYCLSAHTAIGGMHGVSAANLAAARRGRSDDARAQAAITLALEIVRTKGRVSDASLAAARVAGLGDGDIVEVVGHVALNIFTNYLNNLAGTEVDFPLVAIEQAS